MTTAPASQEPAVSIVMEDPPGTVLDRPLVTFGRAICGDLDAGLRREWLVTNGLGGYASGTLSGVATRRYHGLLVAALQPPVGRTVLVGGMVEHAVYGGRSYALSAQEYADGTIDPRGFVNVESFELQGTLPVWRFALGDALLERRLWMPHGSNTTCVAYRHLRGSGTIELTLTPLVTCRDFHSLSVQDGWQPAVTIIDQGVKVDGSANATPSVHMFASGASFQPREDWYWNVRYREEAARGLDDQSNLFAPGSFQGTLSPGGELQLVLTTEQPEPQSAGRSLATEQRRQRSLLETAGVLGAEAAIQQLTLAADQFVVDRWTGDSTTGKTVIAGYHWFNDWGRDTMISLPGLTLATGRTADAADILRTFALYIKDGLLPNNFPDRTGAIPGYNTVDATLWYVIAINAYVQATGDQTLIDDLLPALQDIVAHHIAGTRYGIGVDPRDGLMRAGEAGVQLTWMDAKVGDWVVTPRIGKPVEINALWYNVLRILTHFLTDRDPKLAAQYAARANQVRAAFRTRFQHPDRPGLADVIDSPVGDDWTVRPNQLFAVSLPYPLIEGTDAREVFLAASRALWTSYGPRSLSPDDPAYHGDYNGDQLYRDSRYHQGLVWCWLTGAYIEAHLRVTQDRESALDLLRPFAQHLSDGGLGSISEILEGDPPHVPQGCMAQAWSVAEVLRVWRLVTE
jgi:predicted glycogen debranching enzyme